MTPTENNVAAQAGDEPTWMTSDLSFVLAHLKENTIFDTARIQREWDEMKALAIQAQVSPRATADVERDAARYQFLRHCDLDALAADNWGIKEVYTGKKLDDAIDAAIATTKPGA